MVWVSKFILLDHMDWMGSAYPEALREEWQQILRTAVGNRSQILFRSGSHNPGFLASTQPFDTEQSLNDLLSFDGDTANRLHQLDRVHTYASFHIARPNLRLPRMTSLISDAK